MTSFPRFTWRVDVDAWCAIRCHVCGLGTHAMLRAGGATLLDEFERVHPKHCVSRTTEPCGPPGGVMGPLAEHAGASVYHCDWKALAERLRETGGCDALIFDAPYSERTHSKQRHGRRNERCNGEYVSARGLDYTHWGPHDVESFVGTFSDLTRGWVVSLTDSELYPTWRDALTNSGRYVFAPLPVVLRGMNVRLAGDGPSSWAVWAVVARPKGPPFSKWGTLPGAYVGNPFDIGENSATASRRTGVVGGKPQWLMERLVEDYSREGDLVCDPTCGAGTTLRAAQFTGRRAIGCDAMLEHAEIAARRIAQPVPSRLFTGATVPKAEQGGLFND